MRGTEPGKLPLLGFVLKELCGQAPWPELIRAYRIRYPGVRIDLRELTPAQQLVRRLSGRKHRRRIHGSVAATVGRTLGARANLSTLRYGRVAETARTRGIWGLLEQRNQKQR